MTTLEDYRKRVEEVEAGECPAEFCNCDQAREKLINLLCGIAWPSAAAREQAQSLVTRLVRLRGRASNAAPSEVVMDRPGEARAWRYPPPALTAEMLR